VGFWRIWAPGDLRHTSCSRAWDISTRAITRPSRCLYAGLVLPQDVGGPCSVGYQLRTLIPLGRDSFNPASAIFCASVGRNIWFHFLLMALVFMHSRLVTSRKWSYTPSTFKLNSRLLPPSLWDETAKTADPHSDPPPLLVLKSLCPALGQHVPNADPVHLALTSMLGISSCLQLSIAPNDTSDPTRPSNKLSQMNNLTCSTYAQRPALSGVVLPIASRRTTAGVTAYQQRVLSTSWLLPYNFGAFKWHC